jgi:peptide/nickel transport system substrate-binding protein
LINKIRFKLELLFYYFKRYFLLILAGAAVSSLLLAFSSPIIAFLTKAIPANPKVIGIEGLYSANQLPPLIANQISYGLTQVSDNNRAEKSPLIDQIEVKNDQKQYIFHLNSLLWHDGTTFTADDVVRLYKISNATLSAPDSKTLVVNLDKEFAPLLSLLSKPLVGPKYSGLGPNQLIAINYRDGYIKNLTLKNIATGKLTIYRFYSSQNDLITAFKLGEIEQFTTNTFPESIATWHKVNITTNIDTNSFYTALFINTEKFSKKQFRQSLAYATSKPADKNERCLGPISPNSWAYNPQIKEYNYNPIRAKELIAEDDPKNIKLIVTSRDLLPLSEKIKTEWQEILGITVTTAVGNIPKGDYDMILSYGNLPQDPDQYLFWHSTQTTTNITHFNNSRIDKLLEEGRVTPDPQERKRIYFDFQRFLLEESPAIFISFPTTHTVSRVK